MAISVRQRVGNNGSSNLTFGLTALTDSVILLIGHRAGTSSVPIANPGGFTDLGQPGISSDAGRTFAQCRIAGSSFTNANFGDGGSYVWEMVEIVGADISNRTVLTLDNQGPVNVSSFTNDLGDFTDARGMAFMCQVVGGNGISDAYFTNFISMGSAWTEYYDGRRDPGEHGSHPFLGIGEAAPDGITLAASWDWSTPSSSWAQYAGIAVLFTQAANPQPFARGFIIG